MSAGLQFELDGSDLLPEGTLDAARQLDANGHGGNLDKRWHGANSADRHVSNGTSATATEAGSYDDDKSSRRNWPVDEDSHRLAREVEVGNVEYKLKLVGVSASRLQQLVTQLKYRLAEGGGAAVYEIGVEDDGSLRGIGAADLEASLATLRRMCSQLHAEMTIVQQRQVCDNRHVAEVLVQQHSECAKEEVRLALIGATGAGKSSLVGVLAMGGLDNGQGSARTLVMRHAHELESGKTSSISQQVLGFGEGGAMLNWDDDFAPTPAELCEQATKLITLLDLCGQERFLKTTLFGLTAHVPDYALLCVGADAGISETTRLHVSLAAGLRLPIVAIISKSDASDESRIEALTAQLGSLFSSLALPPPLRVRAAADLARALAPSDKVARRTPVRPYTAERRHVCVRGQSLIRRKQGGGDDDDIGDDEPPAVHADFVDADSVNCECEEESCEAPSYDALGETRCPATTPVLAVSARTGDGLPLLIQLLHRLPGRDWSFRRREPLLLSVDGCHAESADERAMLKQDDPWASTPVQETAHMARGPVICGTILRGVIDTTTPSALTGWSQMGASLPPPPPPPPPPHALSASLPSRHAPPLADTTRLLLIGPDARGAWAPASVLSIKYKELDCGRAEAGQSATVCLQVHGAGTKLRRGMVMIDGSRVSPHAAWEFDAAVTPIQLPTPVAAGSELVLHTLGVKQAVRVLRVDGGRLQTGRTRLLRFRFVHAAEFLLAGAACIVRVGSPGAADLGIAAGRIAAVVAHDAEEGRTTHA